jgi:hypothetical protein
MSRRQSQLATGAAVKALWRGMRTDQTILDSVSSTGVEFHKTSNRQPNIISMRRSPDIQRLNRIISDAFDCSVDGQFPIDHRLCRKRNRHLKNVGSILQIMSHHHWECLR